MAKKVLKMLDHTGHTTFPITEKTEAEAQAIFQRHLAEGGAAFKMEGTKSTSIRKFEEIGEETLLVPQLVGG